MPHRIAIGAIFTESNHLCGTLTNLDAFTRTELRRGDELHAATGGVLGGALAHLRGRNVEIVPLIFASACPGGLLTADCYRALKDDLLARLRAALPVDGVLMPLHGAAAVDGLGSLDEDLIAAVRAIVRRSPCRGNACGSNDIWGCAASIVATRCSVASGHAACG